MLCNEQEAHVLTAKLLVGGCGGGGSPKLYQGVGIKAATINI